MIGEIINNYEIDELIDEGGMSIVYLGIHKTLKRKAAIKMLDPTLAKMPQHKKRFKNEARLLSGLNHPNIVTVYDFVENDDGVFLITEYVKGQTLDEYIDLVTGPMPETKATKLMLQMLDAVSHLHSKNIIHRDLKPSNFIVTQNNEVKLIDFGIAKSLEKNSPLLTKTGSKIGTTMFMSPEQIKGRILDRRSDIYSLGAVFFQMVTGLYPYDQDLSEYEITSRIVNEAFPNPQNYYVGVSDKVRNIIGTATEKKPLDRFQSCEEFSIALLQSKGQKIIKTSSLSLKTKIIEASDFDIKKPIFSTKFWQNFVMLIATLVFLTVLALGVFFLTRKDVRHIISGEEFLLTGDSINAEVIEKLNFGETVRVIGEPETDKIGNNWIKVYSLRNNVGYVPENNIANLHIYKQINKIIANRYSQLLTPSKYKRAIRDYFIENDFFEGKYSNFRFIADAKKSDEFNTLSQGDFDNNGKYDFACVVKNIETGKNQLLIFFDDLKKNISVKFDVPIKIKTIIKGRKGGKWFVGNYREHITEDKKKIKIKTYEYLDSDAVLVFNTETKENILYIYNNDEKSINVFNQSSE